MKISYAIRNRKLNIFLALALFGATVPALAQNQSTDSTNSNEPPPGYPVAPPDAQSPDATSPQQSPATPPLPQAPPPPQSVTPQSATPVPPAPPAAHGPVPTELTLPSGTIVPIRLTTWLSSEQNHVGDTFSASLDQPLVAKGWLVARRGQTVIGRVNSVKKAGHFGSTSELGLELSTITLVDGQQVSVHTNLAQRNGRSTAGPDAAVVGTTTGVGAAVGAATGGGYGAGVGAGIGAMAGLTGVFTSRGYPTVIRPEALLNFQLTDALTVNTQQSVAAFQPVRPSDYRGDQDAYARGNQQPRLRGTYPPPPPPPAYGYPYPYYGYPYYGWGYPAPVVGFGFGWGWGPRWGYYRP